MVSTATPKTRLRGEGTGFNIIAIKIAMEQTENDMAIELAKVILKSAIVIKFVEKDSSPPQGEEIYIIMSGATASLIFACSGSESPVFLMFLFNREYQFINFSSVFIAIDE
tara:strand:- start:25 stop:357 length:333 start_codon:yes stop_codon:yes gene_type:complete